MSSKSYFRVIWTQNERAMQRDIPSMRQADAWARDVSRDHGTAELREGVVLNGREYQPTRHVAHYAHGARARKTLVA